MLKEMRRQNREQQRRYRAKQKAKNKQANKERKPVRPIKEINEKIKVIQKENEKRKSAIITQRWKLRIKLPKDNTDKQPTVQEEGTYTSRSKYDRERKEQ